MRIILLKERPMSLNKYYAGMHWKDRSDEVIRVRQLVRSSLKPHQKKMFINRVNIFITAYFSSRPQDSSNIVAKIYEDALKGIVIFDDSPKYVGIVATESRVDKDNPRVEIYIEEQ